MSAALTYDESTGFNQNFITSGFWIGFYGKKEGSSSIWTTEHKESLPVYTKWATDYPTDIYQDKRCVYLDLGLLYSARLYT